MPVTLPLELVLDIVSVYIQRDFFDEDWAPYHHRLAPLCLVCKDFKELVQPVLWSHLRVSSNCQIGQLVAANLGHLFPHVKAVIWQHSAGGWSKGVEEGLDIRELANVLPDLEEAFFSSSTGSVAVELEGFAHFTALRSLALEEHELRDFKSVVTFPVLEELSLVWVAASSDTFRRLFQPICTPVLKFLALKKVFTPGVHNLDDPMYTLEHADLRRLAVLEIFPDATSMLPPGLLGPAGPLGAATAVLLSFGPADDDFELVDSLPPFFKLEMSSEILDDFSSAYPTFPALVRRIVAVLDFHRFEAIFLPTSVREADPLEWFIQSPIKTLLSACKEHAIPVAFYYGSDESLGTFATFFPRWLATRPHADENPLVLEVADELSWEGWSHIEGLDPGVDEYDMYRESRSFYSTEDEHDETEEDWTDEE